jgi:hypothetical protein
LLLSHVGREQLDGLAGGADLGRIAGDIEASRVDVVGRVDQDRERARPIGAGEQQEQPAVEDVGARAVQRDHGGRTAQRHGDRMVDRGHVGVGDLDGLPGVAFFPPSLPTACGRGMRRAAWRAIAMTRSVPVIA